MRCHNNHVYAYWKIIIVFQTLRGEKARGEKKMRRKTLNFPILDFRRINLHFHSIMIYYRLCSLRLSFATRALLALSSRKHFSKHLALHFCPRYVCKFISRGTEREQWKTICQTEMNMPRASSIKILHCEQIMRRRGSSPLLCLRMNQRTNHRRVMTKWFPWELICRFGVAAKHFKLKHRNESFSFIVLDSRASVALNNKCAWKKKMNRGKISSSTANYT